jgi:hypothetical protein
MRSSAFIRIFQSPKAFFWQRHTCRQYRTLCPSIEYLCKCLTLDRTLQRLFGTDLNVFVFLLSVLGLKLQGELSALPPLSPGQPFARHDRPFRDEDVLHPLFRRDLLLDGEELVGERSRVEVLFGNFAIGVALCLFVVRNVAETSIQPVVT